MLLSRFFSILFVFSSFSTPVVAQNQPVQAPQPALGQVEFAISCTPAVRPAFSRGVALLHSFQYEAADAEFKDVSQRDPDCAMAYWGMAMTLYQPLWDGAGHRALIKGHDALETARKLVADPRERDYIAALAIIFEDASGVSSDRLERYSVAMRDLARRYPDDGDAQAFYALSLLALPEKNDDARVRRQAIAILNLLAAAQPKHPGAAHYLIHAADTPELAQQGLAAARSYAAIAPDSSHALHMPSHIFVRLGLWPESIESNLAAAAAAAQATANHVGDAHYQFHAMDFLDYSYVQTGQESKAREVVEDLSKVPGAGARETANVRFNLTTRNLLELHRWKELLALPADGPPREQQTVFLLHAIAAARTGDRQLAEESLKGLKSAFQKARRKDEQLEKYNRQVAESWVDYAKGKRDKAFRKMRAAADMQDRDDPGPFGVTAREMLGDMLLESHQPARALVEYESALKLAPNRFNTLYGAAAAAQQAGDSGKAKTYYSKLRENCPPQADREELRDARVVAAGSQ